MTNHLFQWQIPRISMTNYGTSMTNPPTGHQNPIIHWKSFFPLNFNDKCQKCLQKNFNDKFAKAPTYYKTLNKPKTHDLQEPSETSLLRRPRQFQWQILISMTNSRNHFNEKFFFQWQISRRRNPEISMTNSKTCSAKNFNDKFPRTPTHNKILNRTKTQDLQEPSKTLPRYRPSAFQWEIPMPEIRISTKIPKRHFNLSKKFTENPPAIQKICYRHYTHVSTCRIRTKETLHDC